MTDRTGSTNPYYLDRRRAEAYDLDMGAEANAMNDVAFYVGLAKQAAAQGVPVLELGCGTGRVTIPIAQAGVDIVGLDNAAPMLEVARRKAEAAGASVRWVEADMSDFELDQRFGLVIIPYRSFQHLVTDEAQASCLRCVRRHLADGGRFALNCFVPPIAAMDAHSAPVISKVHKLMALRYVSKTEMQALLTNAGLQVESLHGGFSGEPFEASSTEMVWVARMNAGVEGGEGGEH